MKLSGKPISSPGRAEKYPPPLMRFLRSNVGSRSRGRTRSSPMFLRKKPAAIETQEPSSPKVTCMGQVRVRRSKQSGNRPCRTSQPKRRRCRWIRKALFCHNFAGKLKPRSLRPVWRKWVSFFHSSFRRKSKIREESPRIDPKFGGRSENLARKEEEQDDDDEEEELEAKVFVSSFSPPKNALILTRCRSAPYRSSSLASRFWGSPQATEETGDEEQRTEQVSRELTGSGKPTSARESISRNSDAEPRLDPENEEKPGFVEEFEGTMDKKFIKTANTEEPKTEDEHSVHPLKLTRCKSEPARIAEKLDPEMSFWKKRRLGFT